MIPRSGGSAHGNAPNFTGRDQMPGRRWSTDCGGQVKLGHSAWRDLAAIIAVDGRDGNGGGPRLPVLQCLGCEVSLLRCSAVGGRHQNARIPPELPHRGMLRDHPEE